MRQGRFQEDPGTEGHKGGSPSAVLSVTSVEKSEKSEPGMASVPNEFDFCFNGPLHGLYSKDSYIKDPDAKA